MAYLMSLRESKNEISLHSKTYIHIFGNVIFVHDNIR